VVQRDNGARVLELNEGQAQHSRCAAECDAGPAGPRDPRSVLTDGYWDGHLVLGFLASEQRPRRIAILGNAAGTTSRAYEEFFPRTRVDGVEIDPELSEIGRRFFDMSNPRLHLYHEDARPFMRRSDALYDQISLDTYRQPYIPFYLTTREFFETVRDRLRQAGALIINVGHPGGEDGLEKVLSATLADVFPYVARHPIESTNTLLVASRSRLSPTRLRYVADDLPAALKPTALRAAREVEPPLKGGEVYTDDRAPVEWLIDKSIVDYAAGGN
jgi:spermidine synthase